MPFALALLMMGAQAQAQQQPQQTIPDAPAPQQSSGLGDLTKQVTPGRGTAPETQQQTTTAPPVQLPPDNFQKQAPEMAPQGQGNTLVIHVPVNYVDVPVTVRDKKGQLVAGLRWQQFRIYEDGQRQRIVTFSADAYPLSVAFVIDDTLPADIMQRVNQSLAAVTGAFTPSDSIAVVTYNSSPELITDFTGAQGARLPAALEMAKKPGREMGVPIVSGPLAEGPVINGQQVDPNLSPQRGNTGVLFVPREVHPLNDAILYAAEQLAAQPKGRRRVIYVISDGKNVRSKASYKEVVQYLLTNNISVFGTMVGDSSVWGIGYLDKMKLPLLQPENLLPRYAMATGGSVDSEFSENGIQASFARLADSVRTQYTLGYISHQPVISGKYHGIEVRIEGVSGLDINSKAGYYPTANNLQ
ncbi:VWA domain-containing protein [Paracidobacterium acidisoli]|uniref:VWA domain-containing protein n=1 Tax=Paracidobacterium acidisoli TaxID=2303751 RepID=UPI001314A9A0|nr:VWA domain-containing protein [Paracidobacterium acidisoli]MBT9333305.1 VWA domain-containing protein [Paracidobacterium acidisoli]